MTPRTVLVVDYGMGNVASVSNALRRAGSTPVVSADPQMAVHADGFVLPGVGAFGKAIQNLRRSGMAEALTHEVMVRRKPILGICLGMQLLGLTSEEAGHHQGLGWIDARVKALSPSLGFRVPHMGWNDVSAQAHGPLFDAAAGSFYFAHSFVLECDAELVAATFDYGDRHVAAIQRGQVFGTQFHPERSADAGLALIRRFVNQLEAPHAL